MIYLSCIVAGALIGALQVYISEKRSPIGLGFPRKFAYVAAPIAGAIGYGAILSLIVRFN